MPSTHSASDKVYQLLAHGPWFSPGTPASSTIKTVRHDIAESGIKHNKSINHQVMVVIVLTNEEKNRMHIDICLFSSTIILIFILFLEFSCKWWKMWRMR